VHLFVFYFGILADDTPPVGLAAYAAAAISRGDPIQTGVQGFAYDIRTALLPFLFIFNTDLLLIDVGFAKAILVFFISLIAMLLFAAATQGYFIAKNRLWETIALLFIAFMLFRPDFFLDQFSDKYTTATGGEIQQLIDNTPEGQDIRITVEGPDFDTLEVRPVTIVLPSAGAETLSAQGLTTLEQDGQILLEEPFGGGEAVQAVSGQEFDYYGDDPVVVTSVQVENDRLPKELFFIPALLLLAGLVLIQRPRATQPAF
jgi:hypothetical protein